MDSRIVAGRYRLERVLGQGGMALVYLATDLTLNRPVAVKLLREQFAADPSFVERFQREARAAATLSHPNIVAVYDLGMDNGTRFIVMEYVQGETLHEVIQREAPLPAARIVRIGTQLADALAYAHSRGIIHRDVKPQNILITRDGWVKVMDFGIAAAAGESSLTLPGTVVGTANYISPEQAEGYGVGPASDVYSAGVVLYEMATGRPPFRASHPMAVARMHVDDPPPRPAALNPALPPGLESIILRALAKDPARRFASAGDLSRALASYDMQAAQFTRTDLPVSVVIGRQRGAAGGTEAIRADPTAGPRRGRTRWPSAVPWAVGALVLLMLAMLVPLIGAGNFRPVGPAATSGPAVAGTTPAPSPTTAAATSTPAPALPVIPPSPTPEPTRNAPTSTSVPPTAMPATATPLPPTATRQPPTPTAAPAASPTARPVPSPTQTPQPAATPVLAPTAPPATPRPVPRPPSVALMSALARVAQEGYVVSDPSSYDESQQLRALIGTAAGSTDGRNQKAFFFLGDTYLGTDTSNPSAQIAFGGEDGNVVTIVYTLYRPQDPMNAPTGGKVGIQYQWNGSRLVPLEPIPPDDPSAPLSRR